jgi:hypothetical protein
LTNLPAIAAIFFLSLAIIEPLARLIFPAVILRLIKKDGDDPVDFYGFSFALDIFYFGKAACLADYELTIRFRRISSIYMWYWHKS